MILKEHTVVSQGDLTSCAFDWESYQNWAEKDRRRYILFTLLVLQKGTFILHESVLQFKMKLHNFTYSVKLLIFFTPVLWALMNCKPGCERWLHYC